MGFSFSNPFSGVNNYLKKELGGAGDYLTKMAKNNNLDKPGGNVKDFTEWVADLSGKGELIMWGHNSRDANPAQAGPPPEDEIFKGSRKGLQGQGNKATANNDDKRRQVGNFNTKTLLTQGQKAKKLA